MIRRLLGFMVTRKCSRCKGRVPASEINHTPMFRYNQVCNGCFKIWLKGEYL